MEKELRVQRIATKVHAVERSIDDTLVLAAELMIEMRGASGEMNLAAEMTDSTFAKLVEAMSMLQTARTSMVSTHRRLDTIREALGLRTVGVLSTGKGVIEDTDATAQLETSVARRRA
jgi:hypothetical protein